MGAASFTCSLCSTSCHFNNIILFNGRFAVKYSNSRRSGIICNSPLFKFFSKPCALFLEDQRCETTGNPGSLFVSRAGFIKWVNIENISGAKFRSGNLLENGNKILKLTMWRVVVVLNMYTKFQEK